VHALIVYPRFAHVFLYLKDWCNTVVLQTQTSAGGYFMGRVDQ
jgi:hypothetical protein